MVGPGAEVLVGINVGLGIVVVGDGVMGVVASAQTVPAPLALI